MNFSGRAAPEPASPVHHPGKGRPGPPPQEQGPGRRPPARLRPRTVQAAPRRRMRHRPPQAQPRRRHPLRQAGRPLPGHPPHRRDQRMAPPGLMKHALADSRSGRKGGTLPWALLVAGSVASLTANVAVAEPTLIGWVIAAWPSFALTASYELLTRQVRRGAASEDAQEPQPHQSHPAGAAAAGRGPAPGLRVAGPSRTGRGNRRTSGELQRQAWHWALATGARMEACPAVERTQH
jgi:hypothetical protein